MFVAANEAMFPEEPIELTSDEEEYANEMGNYYYYYYYY